MGEVRENASVRLNALKNNCLLVIPARAGVHFCRFSTSRKSRMSVLRAVVIAASS